MKSIALLRGNTCAMCVDPEALEDFFEGAKLKLKKEDMDKFYEAMGGAMTEMQENFDIIKTKIVEYVDKQITVDKCKVLVENFKKFLAFIAPCETKEKCAAEVKER